MRRLSTGGETHRLPARWAGKNVRMETAHDWPHDPFTVARAANRGIPRHHVYEAVVNRELQRVIRGVYARHDLVLDTLTRARAASLVINAHSVVCDRTAAWLHGVDVWRYSELDAEPPLETYVLRGHDPTDRAGCRGGTRDLEREDWLWMGDVRVTTPGRTAVDLACKLRRRGALAAVDALMRAHDLTHQDLQRLLRRFRRRRGVVQARQILAIADPRSESPGESWTRLEIIDRGLPVPELQYWVIVAGVPTYRLDLAYPHARIAIEYDGEAHHTSPADRARDEERRAHLRQLGWTVIVVTKNSFTDEALLTWTRQIRQALKRAATR